MAVPAGPGHLDMLGCGGESWGNLFAFFTPAALLESKPCSAGPGPVECKVKPSSQISVV